MNPTKGISSAAFLRFIIGMISLKSMGGLPGALFKITPY